MVDGYAFVDKLSWDNFHEGVELKDCIEAYHRRFGFYPKAIAADKLYRNRDNFKLCKQYGIHLSGPRLGRPPKQRDKSNGNRNGFTKKSAIPLKVNLVKANAVTGWAG